MTYPKACKGVKKLFTAGILSIVGSVCIWLAAIPGIIGIAAAFNGSIGGFFAGGIGALLLLLAGLLLPIIAYIIKLVGLGQAGKDDPQFYQGFLYAALALIFIIADTFFTAVNIGDSAVEGIVQTACGVLDVFAAVYVVYGIQNLARKLEDYRMVLKGSSLVKYITVFYAAGLFATLLSVLFGTNLLMQILVGILSMITSVLNLISYIMFLVYLGRARKMLKSSKESPGPASIVSAEPAMEHAAV